MMQTTPQPVPGPPAAGPSTPRVDHLAPARIAYLTSRFPHLTETFILSEIRTLRELGATVDIVSLRPPVHGHSLVQPAARPLVDETLYPAYALSRPLWAAHRGWLRRDGHAYVRLVKALTEHNRRNPLALAKAWLIFPKAVYLATVCLERGVEHLHAAFASTPATAAWIVSHLTGLPYSFAARAVDIYGQTPRLRNEMLDQKLADATFVVTITQHGRRHLLERYGNAYADKIHVIHSSVDGRSFSPRGAAHTPHAHTQLLSVGRLIEKKGHRYLVQACRVLADNGYRIRCDIIGEGPAEAQLRHLVAAAGLERTVLLRGPMTHERLVEYYHRADLVVLPSVVAASGDRDGIPVVLMEALATETPVISTSVAGIPELIVDGETGILVPPRNARQLADAIEWAINNPVEAATTARRGRERVLDRFDRLKNGRRLLDIISGSIARQTEMEADGTLQST